MGGEADSPHYALHYIYVSRSSLLLTGLLLAAMMGLGAADALLVEGIPATDRTHGGVLSASSASSAFSSASFQIEPFDPNQDRDLLMGNSISSVSFSFSSLAPIVAQSPPTTPTIPSPAPAGAVKKRGDINVLQTVTDLGFTTQDTREEALLSAVIQGEGAITKKTVLFKGDRAGLLVWVETPNVKQIFLVLKESLHSLFSAEVRDLLDENQSPPGKAPRNFLTFLDPGISEERIVFVRVRERLYEFRIAPSKADVMYKLIETLTE